MELATLLNDEQRAALQRYKEGIVVENDLAQPAKTVVHQDTVVDGKPRKLTKADILVIPKGYAKKFITVPCVDCQTEVKVRVKVPKEVADQPRAAICSDCGSIRVRFAAIAQQRIDLIHRQKQENNVPIDLNSMPRAAVGDLVVETMQQRESVKVKKRRAKAVKAKKKEEKVGKKGVRAEQKRRKGHVLTGFKVNDRVEVPTLDLSEVSSLDECASAKERSPYNKARNALERGAAALDPEETTYRVLEKEHGRLARLAAEKAAEAPKKAKKKKGKEENVLVDMDLSDPAILKALAKHLGVSKKILLKQIGA